MPEHWPLVDASGWRPAGLEPKGMNEHVWLAENQQSRPWLFKVSRETRSRALPEHVVEKLASELARTLTVPAAEVQLGERGTDRGALVKSAKPSGWELHAGQELMSDVVRGYLAKDRLARGHKPLTIKESLDGFTAPPDTTLPQDFTAFDTFAGYLIFDALIAHGDRHDRNWAVLRPPPGASTPDALCASFDHAASLGHTLDEAKCATFVRENSVRRWALRGRADRFEHQPGPGRPTLVEIAGNAARLCRHDARRYWQERLLSVDRGSVDSVVHAAPDLADLTREFVVDLVMINRERLLHELD